MSRPLAALAAAAAASALLAGCTTYDRADAEATIVDELSDEVDAVIDMKIESADCPAEVDVANGTTFVCTATLKDGQELMVDATVRDDQIEFNIPPRELQRGLR